MESVGKKERTKETQVVNKETSCKRTSKRLGREAKMGKAESERLIEQQKEGKREREDK